METMHSMSSGGSRTGIRAAGWRIVHAGAGALYGRIARAGVYALAGCVALEAWADPDVTLTGDFTQDYEYSAKSDTTINLDGVSFHDCQLKLKGDKTFTLNLVEGTENTFLIDGKLNDVNVAGIKATKASNITIVGTGTLKLVAEKKMSDDNGVLVCSNLVVNGGTTSVTFDANKPDSACIFLKGNYLQTAGTVKVDMKKKNSTNEFYGVRFDTRETTFTIEGGEFNAQIGGTKSRAIDLKKSGTAYFRGGKLKASFEGPEGRFASGGSIVVSGGDFDLSTNVTAKMTADFLPVNLAAFRADYSIAISGGSFEADLPLAGSEVFTMDSETGLDITVSGGDFDLVAGDDCLSAKRDIVITGGRLRAVSTLDDAIDANGSLTISGGDVRAYATAPEAHGMDVNKGGTLTISGGVVVATDGLDAIKIGSSSDLVGGAKFDQATYYGTRNTSDCSQRHLRLEGVTNGVPFVVKPCLPQFPANRAFNLLVSVPGRAASTPVPLTAAEAYSDASSSVPLVFEKKSSVLNHTVTTKEGAVIEIPEHYDLSPTSGKTKTVTLALNALAKPEYSDLATDGLAAIACADGLVNVGVRTRRGLVYRLRTVPELPAAEEDWTDAGSPVVGDGGARTLSAPAAQAGFFKVRVTD